MLSVAGSLQVWCSHDILLEQLQVTCSRICSSLQDLQPSVPCILMTTLRCYMMEVLIVSIACMAPAGPGQELEQAGAGQKVRAPDLVR